jgi:hypothetical protein
MKVRVSADYIKFLLSNLKNFDTSGNVGCCLADLADASSAGKQGLIRDFTHVVIEARWPPPLPPSPRCSYDDWLALLMVTIGPGSLGKKARGQLLAEKRKLAGRSQCEFVGSRPNVLIDIDVCDQGKVRTSRHHPHRRAGFAEATKVPFLEFLINAGGPLNLSEGTRQYLPGRMLYLY